MITLLGEEILSLIIKEIIKHQPEIQDAIMKELEVVASTIYKYAVSTMTGELTKLEEK
jgi:DNA-binding PadR family transcriptional regulator